MTIREKKDKYRICLDPSNTINKARVPKHPILRFEDILLMRCDVRFHQHTSRSRINLSHNFPYTFFSGTGSFDCLMESQAAPRSIKRDNRIPLQDWKASVTLLMMFLFMDVDKQKERPRKIIMRIFIIFCCEYNKWDSRQTLPSGGSKLKRRFSWDSSSVQKGLAQFHPCSKQSSATREYLQETSQHSTTGTASHAHKTPIISGLEFLYHGSLQQISPKNRYFD